MQCITSAWILDVFFLKKKTTPYSRQLGKNYEYLNMEYILGNIMISMLTITTVALI